MSSLDQDQRLHLSCCDKTTFSKDASDACELAKQPLQGLKLASHAVLEEAQQKGRLKCSKCGGSRMFFCYTCCSLVGVSPQEIPLVKVRKRSDSLDCILKRGHQLCSCCNSSIQMCWKMLCLSSKKYKVFAQCVVETILVSGP